MNKRSYGFGGADIKKRDHLIDAAKNVINTCNARLNECDDHYNYDDVNHWLYEALEEASECIAALCDAFEYCRCLDERADEL